MPTNLVNTIAQSCGISLARVEKMWDRAKKAVQQQGLSPNDPAYWARVVTQVKLELSQSCRKKLGWKVPVDQENQSFSRAHHLLTHSLLSMTRPPRTTEDGGT